MADVGDIAAAYVLTRRESTAPDAISKIVEAHAVGAADYEPGLADLGEHALAEIRFTVLREYECGHDRRGARAVSDDLIECVLDALVAYCEDHVLDRLW